ncbi:MAG: hypothetical protein EB153_07105 [Nitrosopumilaceae archaeon]|nr:hypothetical protein [Nitrosopumilaceae archaeon]
MQISKTQICFVGMVSSSVFVNDTVQVLPNPYAITIKPRLEYSIYVTGIVLEKLELARAEINATNAQFYSQNDVTENAAFAKQVEIESSIIVSIEAIKSVRNVLLSISQISAIEQISPLVSLIRMINSNIYGLVPTTRHDLVELSTSLGSIVMDSGCLLESKFDFKQTNLESKQILTELNLIAESKIRKQYPNLNF